MTCEHIVFTEPLHMRDLLVFSCKNTIGTYSIVDIVDSFDSKSNSRIVIVRDLVHLNKVSYMTTERFNAVMEIQYIEYPELDESMPIEQYLPLFRELHFGKVLDRINQFDAKPSV